MLFCFEWLEVIAWKMKDVTQRPLSIHVKYHDVHLAYVFSLAIFERAGTFSKLWQ